MPCFYFDVHDGELSTEDDVGLELPNWDAARFEAVRALPDLARDILPKTGDRRDIIVDVRDANKRLVFTAQISFAARRVE